MTMISTSDISKSTTTYGNIQIVVIMRRQGGPINQNNGSCQGAVVITGAVPASSQGALQEAETSRLTAGATTLSSICRPQIVFGTEKQNGSLIWNFLFCLDTISTMNSTFSQRQQHHLRGGGMSNVDKEKIQFTLILSQVIPEVERVRLLSACGRP